MMLLLKLRSFVVIVLVAGDVINHGKHEFWGKPGVHYHQGMKVRLHLPPSIIDKLPTSLTPHRAAYTTLQILPLLLCLTGCCNVLRISPVCGIRYTAWPTLCAHVYVSMLSRYHIHLHNTDHR